MNAKNQTRKSSTAIPLVTGLLFPLVVALLDSGETSAQSAVTVTNAEQVIQKWSPDQHLYVKGDVGITANVLGSLETWLDQRAPHWTVVLMRNSNGESYTAIDRRSFFGMDAVEFALGHGLASRTPFGTLEHPTTGETDGAVFVVFLDERKFSYFGSDAQDRRSLGESNWIGNLDQSAVRVMRSTGSLADAVKATVTSINQRLAARIEKEVDEKERIARERRRAVEQVKEELAFARAELKNLNSKAATVSDQFPDAKGELTNPPIDDFEKQLQFIEEELSGDTAREMAQRMAKIKGELTAISGDYEDAANLDSLIEPIRERMGKIDDQWNVSAPHIASAEQHIASATTARDQGDRGVGAFLDQAKASVADGEQAVESKKAEVKRSNARRALIQKTALAASGIGMGGALCGLVFLNRRRKPARDEALEVFEKRDESVSNEMDKVLELFSRSDEILGSKEKVAARGYEGDTRRLSDQTFESVDDLLIMSNEVQRVMDESRELIHPKDVTGSIANAISSSRYERGISQITGEPLKFRRDRGLPIVLEEDLKDQFEDGELPEEVTMTFEQVFKAFRKRTNDATVTLDIVENALVDVNEKLTTLQERVDEATSLDRELDDASEQDGFFEVPAFFEVLLPSAGADYDKADEISGFDPVQAANNQIPSGMRKINNALSVAKSIKRARSGIFPRLQEAKPKLTELGYDIQWIETRILELSDDANWLFESAAKQDVTQEATEFDAHITLLGETAERCVAMAEKLKSTSESEISRLEEVINSGRDEIASTLKISDKNSLHEYNNDPDTHLAASRSQFQAVVAAIHRGDIDAATASCEAMENSVSEGNAIVTESLDALKRFNDQARLRTKNHGESIEKLAARSRLGEELKRDYAPAALLLRAGDATYHDQTATVQSALETATSSLDSTKSDVGEAEQLYKQGRVLEAMTLLKQAGMATENAEDWMEDVASHANALRAKSRENESELEKLIAYTKTLRGKIKDPRIMQPTIEKYARLENTIEGLYQQIEHATAGNDPFAEAVPLADGREQLELLESQMHADHNAHAEATRAVRGAEAELAVNQRLVRTAATDRIPDSATTTTCIRRIGPLESQVGQVASQLNVAHGDWQQVDEAAAALNAQLGVTGGELRGELNRARSAAEMLEHASRDVYQATRWSGPFGIRIGGSPGAGELDRARQLLNQGNYTGMVQMARAAISMAGHAVQQAERQVARRRREQQRAAEQARRARARRSRPSSGFGSTSSSRPSRTFGGGRSSSRGSGSGFKRSGW